MVTQATIQASAGVTPKGEKLDKPFQLNDLTFLDKVQSLISPEKKKKNSLAKDKYSANCSSDVSVIESATEMRIQGFLKVFYS